MAFSLQSFRKTLLYQAACTNAQIQAHLKQVASQDQQAEKLSKQYGIWAALSGVAAGLSLFGIETLPALWVLTLLLLVAMVVLIVLYSRQRRLNVADVRYQLPGQLTQMLGRDMVKDAVFDVKIDFSSPTLKSKQTAKGPYPLRPGWKQAFFEDPWFCLRGEVLDGTEFTLLLNDLTVIRSGFKRSRSGKRKHKSKTKPKGTEAKLLLKFSRKKYGAIVLLKSSLDQAITLPREVEIKKIKVNDHQLWLEVKVPPHSPLLNQDSAVGLYRLFSQMLLSAYHALNLSKALSKAA